MSVAALIILFLILLITFSVIFNFWIHLLAVGGILLLICIFAATRAEKSGGASRSTRPASLRLQDSRMKPDQRDQSLRNRIEKEWERQSRFGDDDLR